MTRIEELRVAVRKVGGNAGPRELAEILWLAQHLPVPPAPPPAPPGPAGPSRSRGSPGPPAPRDRQEPPATAEPVTPEPVTPGPAAPPDRPDGGDLAAELPFLYVPPATTGPPEPWMSADAAHQGARRPDPGPPAAGPDEPGGWGAPVRVPRAPGLTDRLWHQRSFRPLKRSVPSGPADVLDEEATVGNVADSIVSGLPGWEPVFRPALRRWLSAVVVVDRSDSMRLWSSVTRALSDVVAETGAFRDVQTWFLQADGDRAVVRPAGGGSGRPVSDLVDPAGRRVVLLLSDCVGPLWTDGRAAAVLRTWSRSGPVAILQPFPETVWGRTYAPTAVVRLTSARPGAPNAEFGVVRLDGRSVPRGAVPVPVMQISPAWLARWARFTASAVGVVSAVTFAMPPAPHRDPVETGTAEGPAEDPGPAPPPVRPLDPQRRRRIEADALVRRFRAVASPPAARLAGYLAMSEPYLPVMRHVHRAMLSPVRPHHLAEVLLSGLMRPLDVHNGRYEFVSPEVVAELLRGLSRSEEYLIERISAQIDDLIDRTTGGFPAVLGGAGALRIPGLQPPFAILSPQGRELVRARAARAARAATRDPAVADPARDPVDPARDPVDPARDPVDPARDPVDPARSGSGPAAAVAGLLAPDRRTVRLLGRDAELDQLTAWCLNEAAGRTAMVVGPAGAGKTRLAVELAARLRTRGWTADIVGPDDPVPAGIPPEGRRLLVLDAVDARTAATAAPPGTRMLVLARSTGEWSTELAPGPDDVAVWRLEPVPADPRPVLMDLSAALEPIYGADRVTAAASAVAATAATASAGTATGADAAGTQPGPVIATALLDLLAAIGEPAAYEAVVARLAGHETGYWFRSAVRSRVSLPAPLQPADCVSVVALFGAPTAPEARALVVRVLARPGPDDPVNRVVEWLRAVVPGGAGGYLDVPGPGPVTDRVVARTVARFPELVERLVAVASPAQRGHAIGVLGRTAADPVAGSAVAPVLTAVLTHRPELVVPAARVVGAVSAPAQRLLYEAVGSALTTSDVSPDLLRDVMSGLPDHRRLFDGRSPAATDLLVDRYRRLVVFSRTFESHLADALRHQADTLAAAGRPDDARVVARERMQLLRRLVTGRPDREAEYADAALRYAGTLTGAGTDSEALRAATAAAGTYSRLVQAGGTAYRDRYAAAQVRRADLLERLDRRPEAVTATANAIDVYRRLVEGGRGELRPILADALLRLAVGRGALGDHLGALTPVAEAVTLLRELLAQDRSRFRPALARALLVSALEHGDLGQAHTAFTCATEAVALYRTLPDTYRPELSAAWQLRAAHARELGRPADAVDALGESYGTDPQPEGRAEAPLARSAHLRWCYGFELADRYPDSDSGLTLADDVLRQAGDLYTELSRRDPTYLVLRAATLDRRARYLRGLRRPHDAIDCLVEASAIYREHPRPGTAAALRECYRQLGSAWGAVGNHAEADRYSALAARLS